MTTTSIASRIKSDFDAATLNAADAQTQRITDKTAFVKQILVQDFGLTENDFEQPKLISMYPNHDEAMFYLNCQNVDRFMVPLNDLGKLHLQVEVLENTDKNYNLADGYHATFDVVIGRKPFPVIGTANLHQTIEYARSLSWVSKAFYKIKKDTLPALV